MLDVARAAVAEAKARANANPVEVPEFINVETKGEGQVATWF